MSFVSCLLGITVFHYLLSRIFSAVVSYIVLGFYYFMQMAKSGPFYSVLTGSGFILLFCNDYWYWVHFICLLIIHVFSRLKSLFIPLALFLHSLLFSFFILFVFSFFSFFWVGELLICPGYISPLLDKYFVSTFFKSVVSYFLHCAF